MEITGEEERVDSQLRVPGCRGLADALVLPFVVLSVTLLLFPQVAPGRASPQSKWRFGLVDDWGLPVQEARAYLYNSTDAADYAGWKLIAWGDADISGNVTISGLPLSWSSSREPGTSLEYRLVVKLKIDGVPTPVTLGNWTILSLPFSQDGSLVQLGGVLNGSAAYALGPYGLPPDQWGKFRLNLFYVALKAVDERGYPLPVTEVSASFCSEYRLDSSRGTIVTNKVVPAWISSMLPLVSSIWTSPMTNGSCGEEFASLGPPFSPNTGPTELGGVGWIIVRVPSVQAVSGTASSLVKNMTLLLKYSGTIIGNFTVTRWLSPTGAAWSAGTDIDGRLDARNHALTSDAQLQGNRTYVIVCSVRWVYVGLYDQNHNPWPTRSAKLTLYDYGAGSAYPWPGEILPIDPYTAPSFNPSLALIRYPRVNTSVKMVVTWYDVTVNVTLFASRYGQAGGMAIPGRPGTPDLTDPSNPGPDGVGNFAIYSDMIRVRLKLLSSGQLPAPLEPDEVDEVDFSFNGRAIASAGHYAWTSYWHGYLVLPDSPLSWLSASSSPLITWGIDEATAATGWLPNGERALVDVIVRFAGADVLDTRGAYPLNTTIALKCPAFVGGMPSSDPALTDYDRTLLLYVGVYDIGFKVMLGGPSGNSSAPDIPLFLTIPNGERRVVWTDGDGVATLRDAPGGTFSSFTIIYRMTPISAVNVGAGGIKVEANTKPLIELLFPAFDINMTVWNFYESFRLVNVNVSLYSKANFTKYGITDEMLDSVLSSPRARLNVLPDGWTILRRDHFGPSKSPVVLYRTGYWSTDSTWPLRLQLMPPTTYSIRISVPAGAGARRAGFRDSDANATLYWSDDPWGQVIDLKGPASVDVRSYVYDPQVMTLDASGLPLCLFENSAIVLAEPYQSPNGTNGYLWSLQQADPTRADYDSYLVRFNSSATNVFHSINASKCINDSDIPRRDNASNYPQQSRYLIGAGNLSQPGYRFIVYYRGVLVFNDTPSLSNPYASEETAIITSVYHYVFKVLNDPLTGGSFDIPNVRVEVQWAGIRCSFWPTINLTRAEVVDEFVILNSTKLEGSFDEDTVERMWGPPADEVAIALLPYERLSPYFSSYVVTEGGVTDVNGELQVLVPIWNDSARVFGTPVYARVMTIPGLTPGVQTSWPAAQVGEIAEPNASLGDPPWSGRYPLWPQARSANLTGLVNAATAGALGLSRSNEIGHLPNGTLQSPIIIRAAANDLVILVKDTSGGISPHQRVEIFSDDFSVDLVLFTDFNPLSLTSSKSFILWGAYKYTIGTTNLTNPSLIDSLELYGMQWLHTTLEPNWSSQVVIFRWPAQLTVQVLAGDGATPLGRAWVLISYGTNLAVDGNTASAMNAMIGANVTASLTDDGGFAAGIVPANGGAAPLSMNLFKGTYLIRVYYEIRGSSDFLGPVRGTLVYDSYGEEPQHRYVYLGIAPPDYSGEDWSTAQFRILRTRTWGLRVQLLDDYDRPIAGARVRIAQLDRMYDLDPVSGGICYTASDGSAWLAPVPGGAFALEAEWTSRYGTKPTTILRTSINVDGNTGQAFRASMHDLELQLVDAGGSPISGARIGISMLGNNTTTEVGVTDSNGVVRVPQAPSGTYDVKAFWYGVEVSPDPFVVAFSRRYVITASKVGRLVVQVAGALGQGLVASQVDVWRGGVLVFTGVANSQGYVSIPLPYGEYKVRARHGGLETIRSASLAEPSALYRLSLAELLTFLGIGLTPVAAASYSILSVALALVVSMLIHEYVIWRRKRLPQLFR